MNSIGRSFFRNLVLVALDAARHFGLRHRGSDEQTEWLPLVLRWRRRVKRHARTRQAGTAVTSRSQWFPQFHFHFNLISQYQVGRSRPSSFTPIFPMSRTVSVWQQYCTRKQLNNSVREQHQNQGNRPLQGSQEKAPADQARTEQRTIKQFIPQPFGGNWHNYYHISGDNG